MCAVDGSLVGQSIAVWSLTPGIEGGRRPARASPPASPLGLSPLPPTYLLSIAAALSVGRTFHFVIGGLSSLPSAFSRPVVRREGGRPKAVTVMY